MPVRLPNQVGEKYGRLTVVADDGRKADDGHRLVTAACACGADPFEVKLYYMRSGDTLSCGCLRVETTRVRSITHGGAASGSKVYQAWMSMKQRCSPSPWSAWKYPSYVGVNVCDEWQTFEGFLANPPSGEFIPGLSVLGRYGDVGDYTPTNARWITKSENAREAHLRRFIDGEPAMDVARRNGVNAQTMRDRIRRGWSPIDAATRPPGKYHIDGEPAIDIARRNGISGDTMARRIREGWPLIDAATLPPGTRRKKSEK